MSGHSKWSQIKRKKAVIDAKKGNTFAKIAKEIIVATRLGGNDPNANFRLRFAIEKAKASLVPQNNIQRAIEKGSGNSGEGSNIEDILYEGYGPGGAAILIQCTTDNRNRTVGDIRSYFSKYNGKLAESGAVSWMFKKRGEMKISKAAFKTQDEVFEFAVEVGAEDVDFSDNEYTLIITNPEDLEHVQKSILNKNIRVEETQLVLSPKEHMEIRSPDIAKNLVKLLELIEEHDDVQNVFCNFDISEDILSQIK